MRKDMKPGRRYFIINVDEPYAEEIYEVLKRSQMAKGEWPEGDISFDEWLEQTFGDKQWREKNCFNCEYYEKALKDKPCCDCEGVNAWEPRKEADTDGA